MSNRIHPVMLAAVALTSMVLTANSAKADQEELPKTNLPVQANQDNSKVMKDSFPAASTQTALTAGGAVVFIDPITREIRQPTPSEIGALVGSGPVVGPPASPIQVRGPGSAVGLTLGTDSMVFMVATKGADGKLTMECVTGNKSAKSRSGEPSKPKPQSKTEVH